jgi:hypothetical protein
LREQVNPAPVACFFGAGRKFNRRQELARRETRLIHSISSATVDKIEKRFRFEAERNDPQHRRKIRLDTAMPVGDAGRRLILLCCGDQLTARVSQRVVDGSRGIFLILWVDPELQERRVGLAAEFHRRDPYFPAWSRTGTRRTRSGRADHVLSKELGSLNAIHA